MRKNLTPLALLATAGMLMTACGGGESKPAETTPATPATAPAPAATPEAAAQPAYPAGFITAADITLGPIDQARVAAGKKIFDEKCHVCHGLSDQKVVGPGWKGVTEHRKPEWIMNMILHTEWMLQNDTAAQNLVELTKAQMTDQGLTKDQARDMLELMRTL
ncbi:MAG: cytochrome c [Bacteroidetes bacterium]|nr:cytochrome c [Bacteroidota bacterium]MBS1940208.1 cytochrome c [Bacteroidota bacterium]